MRQTIAWTSAAFLGLTLLLIAAASNFWADDYRLSRSDGFHVGLLDWSPRPWREYFSSFVDPRVTFFNDAEYGPYRGSIIGLEGDPDYPQERWFGDSWGIYFRHFLWSDGVVLWTLTVSLWFPVIAFSIAWLACRHYHALSRYSLRKLLIFTIACALVIAAAKLLAIHHPLIPGALLLGIVLMHGLLDAYRAIRAWRRRLRSV